jgi:phosphoribosylanthranilate isomerase
VIFADSPRRLSALRARDVLDAAPPGTARVGVFGPATATEVADAASRVGLDVVQLHGDPNVAMIQDVRSKWNGLVWAVLRITGATLPASAPDLFAEADGVVLDARVDGMLGGTGTTLSWDALREPVERVRHGRARLVLAGGLNDGNVAKAVAALEPDAVDVSSGVESSVGIKDHALMRAFKDAALAGALK